MSGTFQVEVPLTGPSPVVIALPPTNATGEVKFRTVALSLAATGATSVRLAVGRPQPPGWRIFEDFEVPVGRSTEIPLRVGDEVASIRWQPEPDLGLVSALVSYTTPERNPTISSAFHLEIPAGETRAVVIDLPHSARPGLRGFLSLATDFGPGRVDLAIGRLAAPGFRHQENLLVPVGRKVVTEILATDEVASVVNRSNRPVGVLVESQAPFAPS